MSEAVRVALTFDAEHPDRPRCPAGNGDEILRILWERDVRATMFIQGRWAEAYPETAKRIAGDGHLIGNHSHYHARLPLLTDDGVLTDIRDAQEAIRRITGADPRPWFRAPFGEGRNDPRILADLAGLGYRNIHWNVELEDWEPWRTPRDIVSGAIDGVAEHGDGAIVLLHTWPAATASALEPMIDALREAGSRFVTVEELAD